ncbi:nickel/cobalt transporter [Rhizobium sp. EC-SD404]|uniref:nickel/cobalt transporter n=1 Tax=Rhizobium sp. EC-SD404 TaxID=2038389 RepID=UPI0012588A8B|nr:nickel/cobalt transporter [Rhizobium sp. EC-SD404]VVT05592.1 Nickel/cobalt efflux system [Rhizobium sp. EC-SD404]
MLKVWSRIVLPLCLACVGAALVAMPALAQSPLGIGTAEPSINTGGFLSGFFGWINALQQDFYRSLTDALRAMREDPWKLSGLIGLSFAYGVFHAAGPGHGKAVISAYMVANEVALRRGIFLSFASALLQGAMAVLVVGLTYLVLRGTAISMTDATRSLEIASFAVITSFGAWLLYRKLAPARRRPATLSAAAVSPAHAHHGHNHHDHHQHGHHHHDHGSHDGHHHGHAHSHGDDACSVCGHSHAPDPTLLAKERLSTREAWSAVLAVGLRPCSGALIVLTFALLNGLYLGGILSVFAMSIGTAITVSALACLAVGAKDVAIRYSGNGSAVRVTNGIEIFGALCVFVIGALLLTAALSA